jgi:hypothetical protein
MITDSVRNGQDLIAAKQPHRHHEIVAVVAFALTESGTREFSEDDVRRAYIRTGVRLLSFQTVHTASLVTPCMIGSPRYKSRFHPKLAVDQPLYKFTTSLLSRDEPDDGAGVVTGIGTTYRPKALPTRPAQDIESECVSVYLTLRTGHSAILKAHGRGSPGHIVSGTCRPLRSGFRTSPRRDAALPVVSWSDSA